VADGDNDTWTNEISSSPLNGQAAELWDNNQDEFKRQVLARHKELEDEEDE
jgi:ubiquitin-conjugating enzyme E2 C